MYMNEEKFEQSVELYNMILSGLITLAFEQQEKTLGTILQVKPCF